ncbi:TPA: type I secretion system permease/ATPase [Morganella morganii subsp. morganii]|uniref:Type I secretion system permease/ATPase n=1 Tax=Morganella morganii TaxID=582 RepID=A0AAU8ZHQ0_MORMO|nr:type I secretion system permease/ATPase [Morganella morganii]HDU8692890.1 type I secretion system permease/ATPase [Morganella morganii subsp. morganii]AWC92574.1 type I secretion system permease/ATPase [Morganella morganii]EKW8487603.1 type I secretion system permease/ATPase [Morganella morganii]HAT3625320.1 type I secretion system permease/ATPase [Morganella morganii]HCU0877070.1 type I secretion system permease/ATPase [Morganella morganii]
MLSGKTRNDITAFIAARKSLFTSLALFSALINLLMLVPSVYMLQVYDRVLPSGNEMTLLMLTLIMAGLLALTGGLDYLRNMLVIRMSNQFDLALNTRVYDAAFQAKLHRTPGHLPLQAQTDLMILRRFITGNGIFAFLDLPWFPLYLLVIALFNPWLGLFACGGAAVLIALALLNERLSGPPLTAANRCSSAAQGMQSSHFTHTEPAEAMGMQQYLRQRWLNRHCDSLKEQTQASDYSAKIMTITKTVRLILQSLMLGLGGWLALDNTISPGMMIAGSILLGRALSPVEQVTGVWKSAKESRLAYQRLTALLTAHPQPPQKLALPVPQGNLSVSVMQAGYPACDTPLLHNLHFSLAPGEVLGIIGPSGAGKSALAKLLAGLWPAIRGAVRLDGADLCQQDKAVSGKYIGYLPQEIALFPGTIADNIARFDPDADPENIIRAAQLAQVHELILQLPQGYETLTGADGTGLSGGQRQRIALARALYGSPALIILDEPNAALDDAGLSALLTAMNTLKKQGKTIVLITHHKPLLSVTDKLLLLAGGRMQLFGPTEKVIETLNNQAGKNNDH